jgi:hypothetical protein
VLVEIHRYKAQTVQIQLLLVWLPLVVAVEAVTLLVFKLVFLEAQVVVVLALVVELLLVAGLLDKDLQAVLLQRQALIHLAVAVAHLP